MMWELIKVRLLMVAMVATTGYFTYVYIVAEVLATINNLGLQIK